MAKIPQNVSKGQMTCFLERQFCLLANKKPVRKKLTHMKGAFAKNIKSRRLLQRRRAKNSHFQECNCRLAIHHAQKNRWQFVAISQSVNITNKKSFMNYY